MDSKYEQRMRRMDPGDVLLLYTDGITDARCHGDFFGIEGLSEVLTANAGRNEWHIIDAVLQAASAAGGGELRDDAAALVVKT